MLKTFNCGVGLYNNKSKNLKLINKHFEKDLDLT